MGIGSFFKNLFGKKQETTQSQTTSEPFVPSMESTAPTPEPEPNTTVLPFEHMEPIDAPTADDFKKQAKSKAAKKKPAKKAKKPKSKAKKGKK
ncbi:hypothetical protein HZB02_07800 [Candidatus Woesearchaeota archaeon]|nr:hypothetical protein [Candidatus Woesearchaeota archaeon]